MNNIKKATGALLTLIMVLSGCTVLQPNPPANTPAINPNAEAANKDTSDVTLYFCYRGENLLAGETRKIDVPVSDTIEKAVVRALLDGPSADRDELSGLFWDGVELVNVSSNEDILFVTLNNNFVSTDPSETVLEEPNILEQKKLAIYSIVNTLVELGKYSRVQILIDREGTETGERITLGEAGWEENSTVKLEPLGREASLLLTPENTLKEALTSFYNKDWTRLYNFTAYNNPDGSVKPELSAFSDELGAPGNILESFKITSSNVSLDGKTAVVMLDYTIKTRAGDPIVKTLIPVIMIRNNDIWELSYSSLVNVLINIG